MRSFVLASKRYAQALRDFAARSIVTFSGRAPLSFALRYAILHYATLRYTTLHYATLRCTTLHYTTLHYAALRYATLHYTALG